MNLDGLEALIFDFDGVLVESVDVKTRAFAALYADHGEEIVAAVTDYHLRHGGISRFDKFRYFQTYLLGGPDLDEDAVAGLDKAFSSLVVDRVVAAPMVVGAQDFLDHCRGRLPLFIVSGTPTEELEEILQRRGIRDYFTAVCGSPATKSRNIADLLRDHDFSAGRSVMIGDALADYAGAAANSVHFLGRVAENNANPFPEGVVTFADFSRLPATWDSQ